MADVTFDGENLIVQLLSGVNVVPAERDIYSAWKRWMKTGTNAKYPLAFSTTAGDPTSPTQEQAPGFFLRNDLGWRIRPPEEDINISIEGSLYATDVTLPIVVPTLGGYTALITIDRSANALVITVGSGLSSGESLMLTEIFRLLGLDSGAPVTVGQLGSASPGHTATGISVVMTDLGGGQVLLTRTP